jgi:hypothetical protein
MVVSHDREFKSSSTTDPNIAPTCESIDQLACPSNSALVITKRDFDYSQKKASTNSILDKHRRSQAMCRVTSPNARRGLRKAAVLLPAKGQGAAPIPGAAHSGDFGVGCQ